jgi:hypothetical protein
LFSNVGLAPIATHEPVGAVAYGEYRKPGANERARYPMGTTTIVALIIVVLALIISATCQSRYAKNSKQCRSYN